MSLPVFEDWTQRRQEWRGADTHNSITLESDIQRLSCFHRFGSENSRGYVCCMTRLSMVGAIASMTRTANCYSACCRNNPLEWWSNRSTEQTFPSPGDVRGKRTVLVRYHRKASITGEVAMRWVLVAARSSLSRRLWLPPRLSSTGEDVARVRTRRFEDDRPS
jgi:hypothetical protein